MKKLLGCLIFVISIFCLVGCDTKQVYEREYKPVYEAGLEITYLLDEMASSEEYVSLYTGVTDVADIIKEIGEGDYTKPKAVYEIAISNEMMDRFSETALLTDLSDELETYVKDRLRSSFVSQINATAGVNSLAASSICTAGKTFINPIAEGTILVYTYENGYPIAVTITAAPDGSASATGTFIVADGFDDIEGIKAYFGDTDIEVLEITQ